MVHRHVLQPAVSPKNMILLRITACISLSSSSLVSGKNIDYIRYVLYL